MTAYYTILLYKIRVPKEHLLKLAAELHKVLNTVVSEGDLPLKAQPKVIGPIKFCALCNNVLLYMVFNSLLLDWHKFLLLTRAKKKYHSLNLDVINTFYQVIVEDISKRMNT